MALDGQCARTAGYFESLGYNGAMSPGYLGGVVVQVRATTTLRAIGMIATASGPRTRMAVYRDNNESPSALVADTAPTALVVGRNHLPVTPVALAPGNYWIMAVYDTSAGVQQALTTTPYRYTTLAFTSAMPSNINNASSSTAKLLNYYLLID